MILKLISHFSFFRLTGTALFSLLFTLAAYAQPGFNNGQDPKPSDKTWEKIDVLSDEFDGNELNTNKWLNTDPNRWVGRDPGLFIKEAISVASGNLRITNSLLDQPQVVNGNTYTHGGGNLTSTSPGQVGYYYECSMKANKTFMSSTFWLINKREEGSGCDSRVTELDIQECVGEISGSGNRNFDQTIHSNSHSRNTSCNATPTGSRGNNVGTQGKVWAAYHTYGAWWKSKSEIVFFLDGNEVYTITPTADFNLPMYIRLVTETYNWNPVPANGGMTGTFNERTTFYDWVRTWRLVDNTNTVAVTGVSVSQSSLSLNVGQTSDLNATVTPNNATNKSVSWTSSNTNVATVNNNGLVTAVAAGSANITVSTSDGDFRASSSVTVTSGQTGGGNTTVTLSPIHDAYLQGTTKFNTTVIRLENNNRTGYLMYDLSGITGIISAASLTFIVNGDAGSGNLNVNLGTSNNWTETNLSDANKPATGLLLGSINQTYAIGNTKTIPLTASAISGNSISLVLAPTGGNDFAIASKENSIAGPQLTITYSSGSNNVAVTGVTVSQSSLGLQVGQTSDLNATVTPNNATDNSVSWSSSNTNVATVNNNGLVMAIAAGSANITVATNNGDFRATSNVTVTTATGTGQTPFLGNAHAIPGSIVSVNFDNGGQGVAYNDTTVANLGSGPRQDTGVDTENRIAAGNIGWVATGEWLEYTVNVATAGTYAIDVQVASNGNNGAFHIEFDGADKTGLQTVSSTGGWGTFVDKTITGVSLSAGQQIMRVFMDGGSFNLGTINFTATGSGGNLGPVTGEFYIVNRASGQKLISSNSTSGAAINMAVANSTSTSARWTKVDIGDGYFFFENVGSGMYIRPNTDQENSSIIQRPTSFTGGWTQWQEQNTSGGYFRLPNRTGGGFLGTSGATVVRSTLTNATTEWIYEAVGTAKEFSGKALVAKISLYPNPAEDAVSILGLLEGGKYTMSIYSIQGSLVVNNTIDSKANSISVSNLSAGVYLVRVSGQGVIKTQKLVIQ